MNIGRRSLLVLAGAAVMVAPTASAATAGGSGHTRQATLEVVASGLNNPRHLTVDRGTIWVAEAGVGGGLQCIVTPEGEQCLGRSGAITTVRDGEVRRVVEGLPSLGAPTDGSYATGPADLSLVGGKLQVLMSTSGIDQRTGLNPFGANGPEMGRLLHYDRLDQAPRLGADFGVHEARTNPDGGIGAPPGNEIESNPYGMTPYRGGYAVADAGANTLLWVDPLGKVHTLAVFPTKDMGDGWQLHSAPTAVEVGPDGALYVAELSVVPGTARVYRVVPGQAPTVYADGLTLLTDLAFDHKGRLLAVSLSAAGEIFPPGPGKITRFERDGSRTEFSPAGLIAPTGIAVSGRDLFLSNQALAPGIGEIVKVRLP
ncbi:hypothetical protein C7C45_31900 [Micromonospora arborensis]|uniref:ScyD/ScyE family protein n=1 Tax=Micromonospora arborensis TaxID=2116518 RepID=A0A318NAC8_9ACTN|nr:ScyD/ScyE family protein [Micromonospora arborensis]PYC63444.1 hypothetical protein C7C45_31900 [Micromonospora arborensis]